MGKSRFQKRPRHVKKFGSQIVIIHKNRFPAMFDDDMCAVNAANFSPRVGCQSGAVASQYSFLTAMDRPLYNMGKKRFKNRQLTFQYSEK